MLSESEAEADWDGMVIVTLGGFAGNPNSRRRRMRASSEGVFIEDAFDNHFGIEIGEMHHILDGLLEVCEVVGH